MIFFAWAGPTPGNSSNCAALAVFRSTRSNFASLLVDLTTLLGGFSGAVSTVTSDLILFISGAEIPAFVRSSTDL